MRRFSIFLALAIAATAQAEPATGWRGNGTGLFQDANPPLEWHRLPRGAMEDLRSSTSRPANADAGDAPLVEKGLLRDWLVAGPFAVGDSIKDFDQDLLAGETTVEPAAGGKAGDQVWKKIQGPRDDIMVFGTAEVPWLDVAKELGFKPNQLVYLHTFLHSPRGGPARIVVDHGFGLKAFVNGKEVYRQPQRHMGLGFYTSLSRLELEHRYQPAPQFELTLQPGWNRLLLKLSTSNKEDWNEMRLHLRIMDPPDVPYDTQNIAWMTELPGRSTSTPILVGDRIFLMAEPDELVCLDKASGRILWTAANNYYEALTPAQRAARPALADKVEPFVAELKRERDIRRRLELRAKIQEQLEAIDAEQFKFQYDGHFEAHFGIVGYTMPTPVSDGERVYVWCGMGVAACYDLAGNRQWITRLDTGHLTYGSSPALADGVLCVFLNRLYGLDAKTGQVLWEQGRVQQNVAAVLAARLAGQEVFITQRGHVIRPKDGEFLYRLRGETSGDTGWSPGVALGDLFYQPKYGVTTLNILDFAGQSGDRWEPKEVATISTPPEVSRKADGGWIDRWTAGSPLIHDGLAYQVDMYQELYVSDLAEKKMLYRQSLDLAGFTHYNAIAVAASPTLVGKHIVVLDNQGIALVLAPGRNFQQIARNQIATVIDRWLPLPPQETLSYSPPLADGNRLYLRGEGHLYCIGSE
jgi:outer membrane protein assembly factor BamB